MIIIALNSMVPFKAFGQSFAFFARNAVNYTTLALKASFKHNLDILLDIFGVLLASDFVDQVWSIEATLEVNDLILDVELLGYIILYFFSGSGCETEKRN